VLSNNTTEGGGRMNYCFFLQRQKKVQDYAVQPAEPNGASGESSASQGGVPYGTEPRVSRLRR